MNDTSPHNPDSFAPLWQALLARRGGAMTGAPIHAPPGDGRAAELLALYAPLVAPPAAADGCFVLAHLAQSLDGRIATNSGSSQWISGRADILHMHRSRALCHAVIVGAGTVMHDDPKLTVREVPGPSPLRVVIDTNRRLTDRYALFRDGAAGTLLVCAEDARDRDTLGQAGILGLPRDSEGVSCQALLGALRARGLTHLFIEGGGVTISRFLAQGCLDRLHVTVAPLLIGSGRAGIGLPEAATIAEGLRFPVQHVRLGDDMLFDCAINRARPGCCADG
ncbi:MAG: RibD family protein [Alphaproteobacteria bacterium]|nr:RibD family protein [Alphaproteobacteria bacterium]